MPALTGSRKKPDDKSEGWFDFVHHEKELQKRINGSFIKRDEVERNHLWPEGWKLRLCQSDATAATPMTLCHL